MQLFFPSISRSFVSDNSRIFDYDRTMMDIQNSEFV